MLFYIAVAYLIMINFVAVAVCIYDKLQAGASGYRVSEKALLVISIIGGSVGMLFTMKLIRHKTLKKKFMLGLPLIIILQIAVLLFLKSQI